MIVTCDCCMLFDLYGQSGSSTLILNTGNISNLFFVLGSLTNRTNTGTNWSSQIWKKKKKSTEFESKQYTRCLMIILCNGTSKNNQKNWFYVPPRAVKEKIKYGYILYPASNPRVKLLIPLAARSTAWVCSISLVGIAVWNNATGMDVWL